MTSRSFLSSRPPSNRNPIGREPRETDDGASSVLLLRSDGRIAHADAAAAQLLGHELPNLQTMTWPQLMVEHEEHEARDWLARAAGANRSLQTVLEMKHADGRNTYCDAYANRIRAESVADDTLIIVRLTRRTRPFEPDEPAHGAETLIDYIEEGAVTIDRHARILSANQAYTTITGHKREQAFGQRPLLSHAGEHKPNFLDIALAHADSGGYWTGEIQSRRNDHSEYPAYVRIWRISAVNEQPCYAVLVRDISVHKAYEARIDYLAHYDALTGLANRSLIEKRIALARAQVARQGRYLSLLYLDLDGFKAVNDSLGHAAGDELLRLVAHRLSSIVSERDTVARQGGDEFVVLLDSIAEPRDAAYVADKIMHALKVPLTLEGQTVFTTASIGISCYPDDGHDLGMLLHNADMAMYRAKRLGHDRYEYYRPEMNANAHWVLSVRNNLYQALERDEFRVYYQPFVDLATGRVTGLEALLRWHNADLGMVAPADFIPIAEETGLIVAVGEWVLDQACRELKKLHDLGYDDLRIAVNLSARQFRQADLAQCVIDILKQTGLEGRFLELEITETVLMEQAGSTLDTLYRLEESGVAIALDDFGTGYSSLNYLKRFPINYLKVDKSFVDGIPQEEGDVTITRTIIGMAQSLGIRVTAEGVETEQQREWLRKRQCEEAQGYLFSMPLAPDDLHWLLSRHQALPVRQTDVHTTA